MTTTLSPVSTTTAPGNGNGGYSLSNGNLTGTVSTGGGTVLSVTGTTGLSADKWYWEFTVTSNAGGGNPAVGIIKALDSILTSMGATLNAYSYGSNTGQKINNGSGAAYGSTYTTGDVIGNAYDATLGNLWFSKNGVWQNSATLAEIAAGNTTHAAFTGIPAGTYYPAVGQNSSASSMTMSVNFGANGRLSFPGPNGFASIDTLAGAGANLVEDGSDRLIRRMNATVTVPY